MAIKKKPSLHKQKHTFCLNDREEGRHTPRTGEMQGVVITNLIQQTFTEFFFGKSSDRNVSNCQGRRPLKEQNRDEESSLLEVVVVP